MQCLSVRGSIVHDHCTATIVSHGHLQRTVTGKRQGWGPMGADDSCSALDLVRGTLNQFLIGKM